MTSLKNSDIGRREEILQEMAEIDHMQRGTLSEQFFKRTKAGSEVVYGPYYVLQHRLNGKHCSQRVSAEDVPRIRSAIEGRERFETLTKEFVKITERLTQQSAGDQDAKKNAKKSARRNSRKPKRS